MTEETMSTIAKHLTIPGSSITRDERQFLKKLAGVSSGINPNLLIVNIGCWQGATLACLRAGAPHARIIGVDVDFTTQELMFTDFEQLHGDSREVHTQMPDNIDLLFIDGDHHYEVVREDIANWMPKVHPGGIIVFHDYTPAPVDMEGRPHLEGVRRAVDEWADAAADGWTVMSTPDSLRAYHKPDPTIIGHMPRLNLGCGTNTYDNDMVNVDREPKYRPEVVCDLRYPLPFRSECFDGVVAEHILEHIGPEYLDLMREIHRVAKPGAIVDIVVPASDGPLAWGDPTHVRAFSQFSFAYFDRRWLMDADYGISGMFHLKQNDKGKGVLAVLLEREPCASS